MFPGIFLSELDKEIEGSFMVLRSPKSWMWSDLCGKIVHQNEKCSVITTIVHFQKRINSVPENAKYWFFFLK